MPALKNTKYERFCGRVLLGDSLKDAATTVGYSPKTAAQKGSELRAKPEVAARIAELTAEATTDAVMSLTEALEITSTIARDCKEQAKDRLTAVEKIFKYHGGYERDNTQRGGELSDLILHAQGTALQLATVAAALVQKASE